MTHTGLVALLLVASAVASVEAFRALRRGWSATSWFVFGLAWAGSVGVAVAKLTNQYVVVVNADNTVGTSISGPGRYLNAHSALLATAVALVFFAYRLLDGGLDLIPTGALVPAIALAVLALLGDGLAGRHLYLRAVVPIFIVLAVASFAAGGRAALTGATAFSVSYGVVAAIVTLLHFDQGITVCPDRKCSFVGVLLVGGGPQGNRFALLLGLGLAAGLVTLAGRARLIICGYLMLLVLMSASRGSIVAAVVTVAVAVICRVRFTHARPAADGRWYGLALSAAGAAMIFGVYAIQTDDPTAYTGRGLLWQLGRELFNEHAIRGGGGQAWHDIAITARVFQGGEQSPHNQILDVAVFGGLVGLVLFGWFLAVVLRSRRPDHRWAAIVPLTFVLTAGVSEAPLGFYRLDGTFWMIVVLALAAAPRKSPPSQQREPALAELPRDADVRSPAVSAAG